MRITDIKMGHLTSTKVYSGYLAWLYPNGEEQAMDAFGPVNYLAQGLWHTFDKWKWLEENRDKKLKQLLNEQK